MLHNDYQVEEIIDAFCGKLVVRRKLQRQIAETLLLLPQTIREQVINTCWFFGSIEGCWAYAFNGNDLRDQHFIFLGDQLSDQSDWQIQYTITHEIGHIVLKHRNSIDYIQSKNEIERQEKEAHEFALKHLTPHYSGHDH